MITAVTRVVTGLALTVLSAICVELVAPHPAAASEPLLTVGRIAQAQAGGAAVVVPVTVDCEQGESYRPLLEVRQGQSEVLAQRAGAGPSAACDGKARTMQVLVDAPVRDWEGSMEGGYWTTRPSAPFQAGAAVVLAGFGDSWAQVLVRDERKDQAHPGLRVGSPVRRVGAGVAVRVGVQVTCSSGSPPYLQVRLSQAQGSVVRSGQTPLLPLVCDGSGRRLSPLVTAEDRAWLKGSALVNVSRCRHEYDCTVEAWRTVSVG